MDGNRVHVDGTRRVTDWYSFGVATELTNLQVNVNLLRSRRQRWSHTMPNASVDSLITGAESGSAMVRIVTLG